MMRFPFPPLILNKPLTVELSHYLRDQALKGLVCLLDGNLEGARLCHHEGFGAHELWRRLYREELHGLTEAEQAQVDAHLFHEFGRLDKALAGHEEVA